MSFQTALEFNNFILTKPTFQALYDYFLKNPKVDINEGDFYGRTPLLVAASQNNIPLVELLIRMGANINQKADGIEHFQGVTALHIAAYLGFKGLVELLIECGAKDYFGYSPSKLTAVHCAVLGKHDDILKLLIENDYSCEISCFIALFKSENSPSISHIAYQKEEYFEGFVSPLGLAKKLAHSSAEKILHDHVYSLKYLSWKAIKDNTNTGIIISKKDNTYGIQANPNKSIQIPHELSQYLESTKLPFKNSLNSFFGDEVTKAIENGDLKKVQEILEQGIQIYLVNCTNQYAHLLILSIQRNSLEVSKLLIDAGASLFAEDANGKCAYDLAWPELKEYMDHVLSRRKGMVSVTAKLENIEHLVKQVVPQALSIFNNRTKEGNADDKETSLKNEICEPTNK